MDWIAERYQGAMRWILSVVMVLIGLLWDLLLRVGLRQHLMSLGAVTLGFVLIFTLMRKYENTMMLTAGLFGAVMMIAPGFGVLFTHFHNGKLGYRHAWTSGCSMRYTRSCCWCVRWRHDPYEISIRKDCKNAGSFLTTFAV